MTTVTLVTAHATQDDLSDDDYRDIYTELREGHSLRQFAELSQTGYSIAWWSQYEAGRKPLTYHARCDLRRAVGLPPLPVPVGDALAANVNDDATVYRVGDDDKAGRVLLVATDDAVTVTWDGTAPQVGFVTPVTRPRTRVSYYRPCLSQELGEKVKASGWDVETIILAGLETLRGNHAQP